MSTLRVAIEGIGVWGPDLAGWEASLPSLRDEREPDLALSAKPSPPVLPPAERRRAPDTLLLAAQAAAEACAMAGRDPATLPCIFSSTQGDIAITDYMCATLANVPTELSPTKFHNSVHNAAVGYWSIATACREASTALSAWCDSFGTGLLEAALQAIDHDGPVLLAVYDSVAVGPLRDAIPHDAGFAVALVIAPLSTAPRIAQLALRRANGASPSADSPAWVDTLIRRNASASALPLLRALAAGRESALKLRAGPGLDLAIEVTP